MTNAQINARRTHKFMVDSRRAAEDRRLIVSADNVLTSGQFDADTLTAIRAERDMRQARLDAFVAAHGHQAIAF